MKKNFGYSVDFDEKTESLFKEAKYLGQGNNGIVYELPDNKAVKIFLSKKVCNDEGSILLKTNGSKYFPKLYKKGSYYIVRDKVEGERMDKYIKVYGLNKELVEKIYKLLLEFKKLKFKKIDIRCKDILVSKNKTLMIIDPKKAYDRRVDYPRHLMKGLKRLGVLDEFLSEIERINSKKAKEWKEKFSEYCEAENHLKFID
ncbi:protein kinase [uncultured Clostridium sp.]|uniref:protein kinase n=1 Tax=uncultured Clostridium sp. TaxID=59620 RepID=UPI0025D5CB5B|nr:protein kinase [uncultured Clostridium sp.]